MGLQLDTVGFLSVKFTLDLGNGSLTQRKIQLQAVSGVFNHISQSSSEVSLLSCHGDCSGTELWSCENRRSYIGGSHNSCLCSKMESDDTRSLRCG